MKMQCVSPHSLVTMSHMVLYFASAAIGSSPIREIKLRQKALFSFFFIFISLSARGSNRTDVSQVGPHQPILTFEKNENPQNIMVIYTKVENNCRFIVESGKPVVDFYWLMDRKTFKPVNGTIKSSMRGRIEVEPLDKNNQQTFNLRINDLKELSTDLNDVRIRVTSSNNHSHGCDVEAFITLGPSDHHRVLRLETIFSKAEKTLLPPFRKIDSITLEGKDVKSGEAVKRTYEARSA
jgi:hypothetical protein